VIVQGWGAAKRQAGNCQHGLSSSINQKGNENTDLQQKDRRKEKFGHERGRGRKSACMRDGENRPQPAWKGVGKILGGEEARGSSKEKKERSVVRWSVQPDKRRGTKGEGRKGEGLTSSSSTYRIRGRGRG